eukprot:TRINITY_DN73636_c0_g1_i1.p1 TRINITY_DN73636_c0_g1~~TRINITY_DN73636_c0_g1_i1.p1  ORF type:complete len:754 (+),score=106.27 TRINITY_DN73636_c0_g1_i1:90-2264(+)
MSERSVVCIVWFRIGDLRLIDNPALWAASTAHGGRVTVVPVFCWCPAEERDQGQDGPHDWSYEGTALQALLVHALRNLDADLHRWYENRLRILYEASTDRGTARALLDLASEVKASEIHCNQREEPVERRREADLKRMCGGAGVRFQAHNGFLFREPDRCPIFEAVGRGLHIFKAFWDGWHKGGDIRRNLPAPERCKPPPWSRVIAPFGGTATIAWPFADAPVPISRVTGRPLVEDAEELGRYWELTEEAARLALTQFMESGIVRYVGSITRDAGPKKKESRLSPYFRLGLISMVDAWWQLGRGGGSSDQARKWLRRCAWRDYAYWMLRHWPDLPSVPMRSAFANQKWTTRRSDPAFEAWRRGETGYPLVDAAMRELRATGYLQQNMRHTVGQFLVEVLGADWRDGEEWFHVTLADSDLAINAMMWQHQGLVGVSQWLIGVDGHPVRHARDADPSGEYVRRWVPELARLPLAHLHTPWACPPATLAKAGVMLVSNDGNDRDRNGSRSYPSCIVEDVDAARADFLARALRCRKAAPASAFSPDGCDFLTLPRTAGLPGHGIWALTERCFRDGVVGRSAKGKAKSGKGTVKGGSGGGTYGGGWSVADDGGDNDWGPASQDRSSSSRNGVGRWRDGASHNVGRVGNRHNSSWSLKDDERSQEQEHDENEGVNGRGCRSVVLRSAAAVTAGAEKKCATAQADEERPSKRQVGRWRRVYATPEEAAVGG